MEESAFQILKAPDFGAWFEDQPMRTQVQIVKRLSKIEVYEHFGDCKSVSFYDKGSLKDAVWELRWQDGKESLLRLFSREENFAVIRRE